MKNLTEIYLNNEKNLNLPATLEILSKITSLKYLHLENDNISRLPGTIRNFKNLEYLYLNDNKLKKIPKQLKGLDHLQYLDINNNQLKPNTIAPENLNFGFKIHF